MRKKAAFIIAIGFFGACLSLPASAAIKAGASCTTNGQVKISQGIKLKCVKSGKKLVWKAQPVEPAAPTSLSAKVSKTSVTLSWKAASVVGKNSARNYVIEYSKNNGVSWLRLSKPISTSRSFIVRGLRMKTAYQFRVIASNSAGNSKASKNLKVLTR
jgi:hypothetical protein